MFSSVLVVGRPFHPQVKLFADLRTAQPSTQTFLHRNRLLEDNVPFKGAVQILYLCLGGWFVVQRYDKSFWYLRVLVGLRSPIRVILLGGPW